MSLRTAVARRIEELERSKTAQEYAESVKKLRTLLDGSLPHLTPVPLTWENDAHDPDVRNAVDRVLGRVWQVEKLDEFTVLRVFNSRRELLFKEQAADHAEVYSRIEKARASMYAREISLADALSIPAPQPADFDDVYDALDTPVSAKAPIADLDAPVAGP